MARRYGKLPSELMELTAFEFGFNSKIMDRAISSENMRIKKEQAEIRARSSIRKRR